MIAACDVPVLDCLHPWLQHTMKLLHGQVTNCHAKVWCSLLLSLISSQSALVTVCHLFVFTTRNQHSQQSHCEYPSTCIRQTSLYVVLLVVNTLRHHHESFCATSYWQPTRGTYCADWSAAWCALRRYQCCLAAPSPMTQLPLQQHSAAVPMQLCLDPEPYL